MKTLKLMKQIAKKIPFVKKFQTTYGIEKRIDRGAKRNDLLIRSFIQSPLARYIKSEQKDPIKAAFCEFENLCKTVKLRPRKSAHFFYSIDPFTRISRVPGEWPIGNLTIDYERFLHFGLPGFADQREDDRANIEGVSRAKIKNSAAESFEKLLSRIKRGKFKGFSSEWHTELASAIEEIEAGKSGTFRRALQRVLLVNQCLWQCDHLHNGFGRMDQYLIDFYRRDIENKTLTKEEGKSLLRDFLLVLHEDYAFKSGAILGDTGQIIVIGGLLGSGEDACNELTEIFLEVVAGLYLTEPKLLFRVGKKTPRKYLDLATKCLQGKSGSPLFSNDDVIVPSLIEFGFPSDDALNYVTAACWEPLIPGKSLDQGNAASLNVVSAFERVLKSRNEISSKLEFDQFLFEYERELAKDIDNLVRQMDEIKWQVAPFMSLFVRDCAKSAKDMSIGAARYNNYGITVVGMGNVVNCCMVILELVVRKRINTLRDLKNAADKDFFGSEQLLKEIKGIDVGYGSDNDEVLFIADRISSAISRALEGKKNRLGGYYKFGLSSPDYIVASCDFPATVDGRKSGEPFHVHISNTTGSQSFTDVVHFCGKMNYSGNRFNGNVLDQVIDAKMIDDFPEKFTDFIEGAISLGVFQMQMTITNSELIACAIKEPEKFPNLIVRVWGFSAYFIDLPEAYKQIVYERTLKSEFACR